MRNVTLGSTGIVVPQNGFGALPIQRDSMEVAADLLRKAYTGGMRFLTAGWTFRNKAGGDRHRDENACINTGRFLEGS